MNPLRCHSLLAKRQIPHPVQEKLRLETLQRRALGRPNQHVVKVEMTVKPYPTFRRLTKVRKILSLSLSLSWFNLKWNRSLCFAWLASPLSVLFFQRWQKSDVLNVCAITATSWVKSLSTEHVFNKPFEFPIAWAFTLLVYYYYYYYHGCANTSKNAKAALKC